MRVHLVYSDADIDKASEIVEGLRGAGVDLPEMRSTGSAVPDEDLERQLAIADTLIIFWSKEADHDARVHRECERFGSLHPASETIAICLDKTLPSSNL